MMPLFANPLLLLGLALLPVVVAVYFFRNRFRRIPVSSLVLWQVSTASREGGSRRARLDLPLTLLLELLIILCLILAAADPRRAVPRVRKPLFVILDNSVSMRAGGEDNPRARGVERIQREVRSGNFHSVRFILAGSEPRLLGPPVSTWAASHDQLAQWDCGSPAANLGGGLALAAELGGSAARVLVITDQSTESVPEGHRIRWLALGRPHPNVGFVNASRKPGETKDRCLLEIQNFSARPVTTYLLLAGIDNEPRRKELTLEPQERRRLVIEVPGSTGALTATLGPDALDTDNEVHLPPVSIAPVRLERSVANKSLTEKLALAIEAGGIGRESDVKPELFITDSETAATGDPDTWIVRFLSGKDPRGYVGPFVLDLNHPLAEGLDLQGVIWSAAPKDDKGIPVIMAGDIPLVTVNRHIDGTREIRIYLNADVSTLTDDPNWPIFVWNLLSWRGRSRPGPERPTVASGMTAIVHVPPETERATLTRPTGETQVLPAIHDRIVFDTVERGTYAVDAGSQHWEVTANLLSVEESDLQDCVTGEWGTWNDVETITVEHAGVGWILILAALVLLAFHARLITPTGGRS